ncbi:PRC-barrel domain-containing protein [Halomonas sp. MA07-2]|uniref:PRC-barrel domain-containing protein n=1 Tax=unclassified Halomonas TaxID=2609666 RepID=UPI003EEF5CFA
MKRTAISIAVGALSIGLAQGVLAQDVDAERNEQQQMTQEGVQGSQAQGAEVRVEGEAADVTVEQEPAEIQVEQQPPNVTVEQQAPQVTIEQPDPNVSVEQADPNVTVEETGEASVEVERAQEVDAQMRDSDQQDQAQQERDQTSRDQTSRDGDSQGNDLMSLNVGDIQGYTIYSQEDGEEIGDVDRVVRDTQSNDIYVVVTKGGFLGFGKDEFGYKLDNVELRGDEELVVRSGDDGVSGDYSSDQYEDLDDNQTFMDSMQRSQGQGN